MPIATSRAFDALRAAIEKIEAGGRAPRGVLPFGLEVLDQRLPGGGLALGALHEVAGGGNGAIDGTASTLFAAGLAARTRGQVLWCVTRKDRRREPCGRQRSGRRFPSHGPPSAP